MKSIIAVVILIIVLIIGKVLLSKSSPDEQASAGPTTSKSMAGKGRGDAPFSVTVMVANEEMISNEIFSSGTLVPNEQVDLRSEASGIIKALYLKEGTLVNKGQLIAKIKDDDIKARLKKVAFEEELARQIEARQRKLLDINAISKEEYDIAVNKINTLSADKDALLVSLLQTEVRAPFSGRIGLKNISVGAYVTPSTTITNLVQTQPIKIDFSIPEKYNNNLSVGRTVIISTDDNITLEREAIIVAIDPVVDETLRSIKLRASLPNANGRLKPGMFVRVSVTLGATKSIMVPTDALVPFAGGKKLFVMQQGKAKEIAVVSGLRTDKRLEIIKGISKGDTIVISGLMNIKDGQVLNVKKVVQ
jgi:membrane fusion protein (multidrug efflux system)